VETGAISTASPARQSGAQRNHPEYLEKGPPLAGFCDSGTGLQVPDLADSGTKTPLVSGGHLKYSRFWETATGDWVRSALRGRRGSALSPQCLHFGIFIRISRFPFLYERLLE
jgi:hypothetical protein